MEKKLIILSYWKGKAEFYELKSDVEENLSGVDTFFYLFCIDQPKMLEDLPQIPSVYYFSKKDFSFFGRIKTPGLRSLLINEKKGFLIVAKEQNSSLLIKILKNSKLVSIGMVKETLPQFDISFKDTQLKNGEFYKQINNYLTKIQL